jgi:hypothetical protein
VLEFVSKKVGWTEVFTYLPKSFLAEVNERVDNVGIEDPKPGKVAWSRISIDTRAD